MTGFGEAVLPMAKFALGGVGAGSGGSSSSSSDESLVGVGVGFKN